MHRNIMKVFSVDFTETECNESTSKIKLFVYESKESSVEETVTLRGVINYM